MNKEKQIVKNEVKNTQKESKREQRYVTGFEIVEGENNRPASIEVYLSDGKSFPAAYNKRNLEKLRNALLARAKYEETNVAPKKSNECIGYTLLSVAGAAGFVILNLSAFGKEISPVVPSTASLALSIASGFGALKSYDSLAKIRRNATFAYHKDEINTQIIENPIVYSNIDAKDKEQIRNWLDYGTRQPIMIENISSIKPETISTIWYNIEANKQFEMENNKQEQGFQKTL